ncbi:MAG: hypothetical protein QOK37_2614 [Thermoanaerobaculia bacterium]|jgi:hypothetical protein|nr:hypothetical protein [Thermoanaerobaculia bacterium]
MMTCQSFRANLQPGTADADVLEHLRHCDACLDYAMSIDPDLFFRAIGGEDLVPPGGVDAFVGDVMSQVRVRDAETSLAAHRPLRVWQRFAIAATIAAGVIGGTLAYRVEHGRPASQPSAIVASLARPATVHATPIATKSFVETYSSHDATIVEMPSDGSDAKVVMIFDDKLPADL